MRLLTPILLVTLLLTGCASTGNKDDAAKPDTGKSDTSKPDTAKPRVGSTGYNPAKRPDAGIAKGSKDDAVKPDAGILPKRPDAGVPEVKETIEVKKPEAIDPWLPIALVAANYPQSALDKGIEGYVILEYTVTKTGSLKDIKVIDSSPHGYFEQDAINAAYKFRYNPKIVNGEPIEVPRAQYKMIFKLEYILPK
jgi:periplasmic protein TonB